LSGKTIGYEQAYWTTTHNKNACLELCGHFEVSWIL
jgi:hypothetical protein